MKAMRTIRGTAAPLERSDVDTDQIIPSEWLKRVERSGFGAGLFAEWRDDRSFVLNRAENAGARDGCLPRAFLYSLGSPSAGGKVVSSWTDAVSSARFSCRFCRRMSTP